MKLHWIAISLLGLGLTATPGFAAEPGRPGMVNYVEGAVAIDGQALAARDVGNAALEPGQELTTAAGRAEILLTPGVFLRVDANSAVRMVSPDLTLTQVELVSGHAGVEVNEIHDQNNLQVIVAGVPTRLEKNGYYEFDASKPAVMVFKGKATVQTADGRTREVKDHHEFALTAGAQKPADFDTQTARGDLYNWSSLRSQYLAEANNQIAGQYAGEGYAPGWYWNPYTWGYTFIGAGPFYSPFGWGYYPFGWYGGVYGGWGGGYYPHGGFGGGFHGGFGGGFGGGGFHGGGGHR
jgi:hypothetical protein